MCDELRIQRFKGVIEQFRPFLPDDVIWREVKSLAPHGYCQPAELKTVLEIVKYERAEELRKMVEAA